MEKQWTNGVRATGMFAAVAFLAATVAWSAAAQQTKPVVDQAKPAVDQAKPAVDQAKPALDDEEQMDSAMRKFGYVSGQAFACHTKEQQVRLERTALAVGTNILRLFGSDRAFFFAAAFGAGASEQVDPKKCPALIKQADEMIGKLKVLSSSR